MLVNDPSGTACLLRPNVHQATNTPTKTYFRKYTNFFIGLSSSMHNVKDTRRATVRVGFDGRVHKTYSGPGKELRYENEVRILKFLEKKGCTFVPKLLHEDPEKLYIITTNCGQVVNKISKESLEKLFRELEQYGVRHLDAFERNVTYSGHLGRFCVIDFEFAENLETGEALYIDQIKKIAPKLP